MVQMDLLNQRRIDSAKLMEPLVYAWLSDGAWHTARSFRTHGGIVINGAERELRIVAERSQGRIISGQKGYKLTRCASVEEIDHAERWLISQANKMRERAVEIRRARNSGGVAA
jgi:DNA-directed RNA polymerase beta subunit